MEKAGVSFVVLGYLVFLIGVTVWLAERWTDYKALRRTVFANLDDAAINGHFNKGEYLDGETPAGVAYDLTCYAEDCQDRHPKLLEPHVRAWMRQKGLL